MQKDTAFSAFFGASPEQLCDKVVITNINPIYQALKQKAAVDGQSRGFYELTQLRFEDGQHFSAVKVQPGGGIVDVLKLLLDYCSEVVFLGIAGCLDPDFCLGEVCQPQVFLHEDTVETVREEDIAICQTSGLIQEDAFYETLKQRGISLVDMECHMVHCQCIRHHTELKYIVQISDFPLVLPFYQATPQVIDIEAMLRRMGVRHG